MADLAVGTAIVFASGSKLNAGSIHEVLETEYLISTNGKNRFIVRNKEDVAAGKLQETDDSGKASAKK